MFAVIKTGGKQYKVKAGDILRIEKLEGEAGTSLTLDNVLMFGDKEASIGETASKAKVTAEIIEQAKGEKVIVFKKKRRHNYRRKNGHRQLLTVVRITEITAPDGTVTKADARIVKPRGFMALQAAAAKEAASAEKPAAAKKAPAQKAAAATEETTEKKPAAKKAASSKKKES